MVSITNPIINLKFMEQDKKSVDYNISKQQVVKLDNEDTEQLPCWKEAFEFDVKGFQQLSEYLVVQVYDSETFIGELRVKAQTCIQGGKRTNIRELSPAELKVTFLNKTKSEWYPLFNENKPTGQLLISCNFKVTEQFKANMTKYETDVKGKKGCWSCW